MNWYGTTHLPVTSFKQMFEVTLGKMLQTESTRPSDSMTPYLNSAAVQNGYIEDTNLKSMWASDLDRRNLNVRINDLVVCEGGDVGRSALVKADSQAIFQNSVHRVRPRRGNDIRFAKYALDDLRNSSYLDVLCNKATIRHFTADKLANLSLPHASPSYQSAACDYLDRETAQIDDLVLKQERLIELLAEKRQAIITRAVTKGLDPTALTKPSGEPWIGDVPEHWSLPRLKNCSQVKRGRFMHRPRNSPHLYDGKYPFIQTGAIARAQGKYITEYSQTLSEAGLETSALMPQGTLVMAIAANIADVALLSFDSCAPDSVLGFQPTNLTSPDFLYYALTAKRAELISEAPITSQGNLNVERVGGVTIPLPPVREQQNIVKKLDEELEQMAQISAKASGMLRLLIERRSALISAAVTGKIDVRKRAS